MPYNHEDLRYPCGRCGTMLDLRDATPDNPRTSELVFYNTATHFGGDNDIGGHGSMWNLCPECGESFRSWMAEGRSE